MPKLLHPPQRKGPALRLYLPIFLSARAPRFCSALRSFAVGVLGPQVPPFPNGLSPRKPRGRLSVKIGAVFRTLSQIVLRRGASALSLATLPSARAHATSRKTARTPSTSSFFHSFFTYSYCPPSFVGPPVGVDCPPSGDDVFCFVFPLIFLLISSCSPPSFVRPPVGVDFPPSRNDVSLVRELPVADISALGIYIFSVFYHPPPPGAGLGCRARVLARSRLSH